MVTSFEDHELWYPDAQTNNIYITTSQDLILSYCKVSRLAHAGRVPAPASDLARQVGRSMLVCHLC